MILKIPMLPELLGNIIKLLTCPPIPLNLHFTFA